VIARLRYVEHLAAKSAFLFGLASAVVNYVAKAPLPPSMVDMVPVVSCLIVLAEHGLAAWRKNLGNL